MNTDAPTPVLELLPQWFEVYKKDFAAFILASLGIMAVTVPLSFAMVIGLYAAIFVGMVPGMAMEDEGVLLLGMLGTTVLGTVGMIAVFILVLTPIQASFTRAVDAHITHGQPISIGAAFSTITEDLGRVLGYAVLHTTLMVVGLMFCYLPGLLFAVVTSFAWQHVVLGKKGGMEAIKESIAHVQAHAGWHVAYIGITMAMALIVTYLPLVGYFIAPGLLTGWQVFVYRKVIAPA